MPQEWYHTQEKWSNRLTGPVICEDPQAWFGTAYYFWYYEDDAITWGYNFKNKTGYFEVYKAFIISENLFDTVFNESHYLSWCKQIEKVLTRFAARTFKPTFEEINKYFKENKYFEDFDGILFQDISNKPNYYTIPGFFYRKRIQIAVYNSGIINDFEFSMELQANKL